MSAKTPEMLTNLELCQLLGWSMIGLYRRTQDGRFPKPDGVLAVPPGSRGRPRVYWMRKTVARFLANASPADGRIVHSLKPAATAK